MPVRGHSVPSAQREDASTRNRKRTNVSTPPLTHNARRRALCDHASSAQSGRMRRTGAFRMGPETAERGGPCCSAGSEKEGGRGRGPRRFSTEKRPRTAPSDSISREPFPRCLRDLGEDGRRGGRERRPKAFFRRKPPRTGPLAPTAKRRAHAGQDEAGTWARPGKALGRPLCVKGGARTDVSRETRTLTLQARPKDKPRSSQEDEPGSH